MRVVRVLAAGRVSSYKGRMQIQIGSSWGKMEKVNGMEVGPAIAHLHTAVKAPCMPHKDTHHTERGWKPLELFVLCVPCVFVV